MMPEGGVPGGMGMPARHNFVNGNGVSMMPNIEQQLRAKAAQVWTHSTGCTLGACVVWYLGALHIVMVADISHQ